MHDQRIRSEYNGCISTLNKQKTPQVTSDYCLSEAWMPYWSHWVLLFGLWMASPIRGFTIPVSDWASIKHVIEASFCKGHKVCGTICQCPLLVISNRISIDPCLDVTVWALNSVTKSITYLFPKEYKFLTTFNFKYFIYSLLIFSNNWNHEKIGSILIFEPNSP